MPARALSGKSLRLSRLSRWGDGRFLVVPMDHSVSDGPIVETARFGPLVRDVCAGGADAIVVHKGRAGLIDPALLQHTALVIHLSAGTGYSSDAHAKTLVGSVQDAICRGADAVSVHVNIGSDTEARQLADLGAVADAAETWGLPLIAMVYARGRCMPERPDAAQVAHLVNIAADLGADIVKTSPTARSRDMADVVAHAPVPVVVAGGACDGSDLSLFARDMMAAGCGGLAVGRRIFRHPKPQQLVRRLAAIVHGRVAVDLPGVDLPGVSDRPDDGRVGVLL